MADISLARELLGYSPSVDFATGLERTIEWIADKAHDGAPSIA
jgi:nucleoside-diphosphate-sugar epimerase